MKTNQIRKQMTAMAMRQQNQGAAPLQAQALQQLLSELLGRACGPGEVWDPVLKRCKAGKAPPRQPTGKPAQPVACPPGQVWDPVLKRCKSGKASSAVAQPSYAEFARKCSGLGYTADQCKTFWALQTGGSQAACGDGEVACSTAGGTICCKEAQGGCDDPLCGLDHLGARPPGTSPATHEEWCNNCKKFGGFCTWDVNTNSPVCHKDGNTYHFKTGTPPIPPIPPAPSRPDPGRAGLVARPSGTSPAYQPPPPTNKCPAGMQWMWNPVFKTWFCGNTTDPRPSGPSVIRGGMPGPEPARPSTPTTGQALLAAVETRLKGMAENPAGEAEENGRRGFIGGGFYPAYAYPYSPWNYYPYVPYPTYGYQYAYPYAYAYSPWTSYWGWPFWGGFARGHISGSGGGARTAATGGLAATANPGYRVLSQPFNRGGVEYIQVQDTATGEVREIRAAS